MFSSSLAAFQQGAEEAFDWPFPHSRAKMQDKGQLKIQIETALLKPESIRPRCDRETVALLDVN